MEGLISLELLAEQPIAKSLMEKGLAEVVIRRGDQKFRSFIKCQIVNSAKNGEQVAQSLAGKAANHLTIEDYRNLFLNSRYANRMDMNTLSTLDLNLFRKTNISKFVPYIGTILSAADIAVDITGFVILSKQLTAQSKEIQNIAEQLRIESEASKNEKIGSFYDYVMRCNDMAEDLEYNELIDLKEQTNLLREMRNYIIVAYENWKTKWHRDEMLQIIFTLLPLYTFLLGEYLKSYYFQKLRKPNNYDSLLSVYDMLNEEEFETLVLDFFVLDKNTPIIDAINILTAEYIVVKKGKLYVEDQVDLVKGLETQERNVGLEKEIEHVIKLQTAQMAAALG